MRSAFYITLYLCICSVTQTIFVFSQSLETLVFKDKALDARKLRFSILRKRRKQPLSRPKNSGQPQPNDERSQPKTNKHNKDSRQHNFKHCAYHRALFFARDVAFLAFMSRRVFPILKSGAPVFWQLVAVHGSYGHAVVPVVLSVFSAHTVIIACIPCKINRFFA